MVKAAYLRACAIELDLYIERVQKLLVEIIAKTKVQSSDCWSVELKRTSDSTPLY